MYVKENSLLYGNLLPLSLPVAPYIVVLHDWSSNALRVAATQKTVT
jgi:hypothetical protein